MAKQLFAARELFIQKPQVVTKGGVAVRPIKLEETVLQTQFPIVRQPTVISQSVPAGTTLVRGAAVDVTMAFTGTLPVDIFENVPVAWKAKPIQEVADKVRANPTVLQLLATHETAGSLSADESTQFRNFLTQSNLTITTDSLDQAFDVARNAHLIAGE